MRNSGFYSCWSWNPSPSSRMRPPADFRFVSFFDLICKIE
uniref:Uncharacterized protein n=1 Tax=Arundo donax TaxID=35708 RepID=A0A0A9AC21_ARUDO